MNERTSLDSPRYSLLAMEKVQLLLLDTRWRHGTKKAQQLGLRPERSGLHLFSPRCDPPRGQYHSDYLQEASEVPRALELHRGHCGFSTQQAFKALSGGTVSVLLLPRCGHSQ